MSTLYPGSHQIPAQKINTAPPGGDIQKALRNADNRWFLERKWDGYFEQLEKIDDSTVYMFSRSKSKKTGELTEKSANVPHIVDWAKNNLPNNTIIIGEAYVPNGISKDVTKILGCLPAKAISRQEQEGWLNYLVHDCLMWDGKSLLDKTNEERYNILYNSGIFNNYIGSIPEIQLAEVFYDNFPDILASILAEGGEGVVLKDKNALYEPSKRPRTMFKIKREFTCDAIVSGFTQPTKEYEGKNRDSWEYKDEDGNLVTKAWLNKWVVGFEISVYETQGGERRLKKIGAVSGLTDALKEDAARNPDKYLGRVIEVQPMQVLDQKEKTLRHTRFIRFRDDKETIDCTIDQLK